MCIVQDVFDVGNLSWLQSSSRSDVSRDKIPDTAAAADGGGGDVAVMVNGALVSINSILENLHRSEDERAQVDQELKNMEQECGMYCLCSLFLL